MRLTSSGAYTRATPVPKMPPGLVELMEGLARDVLKNNPSNVYEFCANHMGKLLEIRDGSSTKKILSLDQKILRAQEKVRQRARERQDKFDQEIILQSNGSIEVKPSTHNKEDTSLIKNAIDVPNFKAPVQHVDDLEHASEVEISHVPHADKVTFSDEASKVPNSEELNLNEDDEHIVTKNVVEQEILIDDIETDFKPEDGHSFWKVEKDLMNVEPLKEIEIIQVVTLKDAVESHLQTITESSDEVSVSESTANLPYITIGDEHDALLLENIAEESTQEIKSEEIIDADKENTNKNANMVDINSQSNDLLHKQPEDFFNSKSENVLDNKEDMQQNKSEDLLQKKSEDVLEPKFEELQQNKSEDLPENKFEDIHQNKSEDLLQKITEDTLENKFVDQQQNKSEDQLQSKSEIQLQNKSIDLVKPDIPDNKAAESDSLVVKKLVTVEEIIMPVDLNAEVDKEELSSIPKSTDDISYNKKQLNDDMTATHSEIINEAVSTNTDSNSGSDQTSLQHNIDIANAVTDIKPADSFPITDKPRSEVSLEKPNVSNLRDENSNDEQAHKETKEVEADSTEKNNISHINNFTLTDNVVAGDEFIADPKEHNETKPQEKTLNESETQEIESNEAMHESEVMINAKNTLLKEELNQENVENPVGKLEDNGKEILLSKADSTENTNEDSLSIIESDLSKTDEDLSQNNPNNMDLETAAVTIQKVFRSFMFKSRNSTFEDTNNDEHNSIDEENDKKEEYYAAANLNKERRPLGISRMDTVLQTVNEEKSLSLSTDDSSMSSAATTIQAHVRGFLVRNRLNSSKTFSMNSLVNSHEVLEPDTEQQKNKTILNIHIVPEEGNYLSRDESLITSMDLSLDGSPPSSVNLHPLSHDISERRKMLKREDAIQSVSPPSNNSGKLSEDSVKEVLINENDVLDLEPSDEKLNDKEHPSKENDIETRDIISSASTVTPTTIITISKSEDPLSSPREYAGADLKRNARSFTKMNSDESDVITPYVPSPRSSENATSLIHSGEFHDVVLPTKVSRNDTSVVRGE